MQPDSGRILLVCDGSSIGDRALIVAIDRATASGATITLLGVIPPRLWRAKRGQFQMSPNKHDEEFARGQLERAQQRCREAGIKTESRVRTGAPAHVIAEEAGRGYGAVVIAERRSLTGAPTLSRVVAIPEGVEIVAVD
jgi:nucleotide-binding universal stress UspA family protein